MTKILHVPTGQFVYFVSSIEYDRKYKHTTSCWCPRVLDIKNSFWAAGRGKLRYKRLKFTRMLHHIISGTDGYFKVVDGKNDDWLNSYTKVSLYLEQDKISSKEFEVIYD